MSSLPPGDSLLDLVQNRLLKELEHQLLAAGRHITVGLPGRLQQGEWGLAAQPSSELKERAVWGPPISPWSSTPAAEGMALPVISLHSIPAVEHFCIEWVLWIPKESICVCWVRGCPDILRKMDWGISGEPRKKRLQWLRTVWDCFSKPPPWNTAFYD